MQPCSEEGMNIADLANQLRKEKIFINSERRLLQNLNEEVEKSSLELLQVSWICSQQRQNLTNLITPRFEEESIAACQRAALLELTTFVDVYKVLRYKEASALGELLGWLRDSPHLVALCLLLGEDNIPQELPSSLVAGLYGSCRSANDRRRLLAVLRSLIKHQLAHSTDPRKLLRTGRCAFAQLYAEFRDGHAPARQFLITALQGPVLSVLQDDDFILDFDPDKAMDVLSPEDRVKKFGPFNSPEYPVKVARYRKWMVQCLYNMASKFTASLKDHWPTFPSTLAWLMQQIVLLLKQHSKISEREIHAVCTDLILTQYICPAIVKPDAHGLVDIPVSNVARTNLAQVAQIIQMLCLARYQEVDVRVRDLYNKFERSCMWSLLDAICSGPSQALELCAPSVPSGLRTEPHPCTTVALYTTDHLHSTVTFLKRISSKLNNNSPSVTSEEYSSGSGPPEDAQYADNKTGPPSASTSDAGSSSTEEGYATSLTALLQNMEPNYRSRMHDLLRKLPDFSKLRQTSPQGNKDSPSSKRGILAKVHKPRLPLSGSSHHGISSLHNSSDDRMLVNGHSAEHAAVERPVVLIIKLANRDEQDFVGLVSESKVLECYDNESEVGDGIDAGSALTSAGPDHPVQKRTRFSVSHDEVSLGNTSDNLEAVSEAASNHSVTSSLELETEDQNDNLSDMVSANVSGRGSPNISGRETPSSQVTDGDRPSGEALPPMRMPQNIPVNQTASAQAKLLKQTQNEIEDKFCKFEIKKLMEGDETISIMSDTWSTDVLASDSETIGDSCEQTQIPANQQSAAASNSNAPDMSETASESAWSIDVLASDSDRNTEVDTDDCMSVAARSDTSWPRRPSHQEDMLPRRANHQSRHTKRNDVSSPRHSKMHLHNRGGGYLSATAHLSRGAELDLSPHSSVPYNNIHARKSILVNGYPVMTCYATSAPESPSTSAPVPLNNDVFNYGSTNSNGAPTESTLEEEAGATSDATSQWVDDSFPQPHHSPSSDDRPYNLPSTSNNCRHAQSSAKNYDLPSTSKPYDQDDVMDRSLNSSESSFNALSVSQYDRDRFNSGIDSERQEERSAITDLMTRMSSATLSTSNLVNNIASRIVKSEMRTSIVSISSSRIERSKRNEPGTSNISLSTLSMNSAETSVSDRSSSQDVNSENVTERRISPPPQKNVSTGAIPKSISFDSTAEKSQRRRLVGEEGGLVNNLDELKNNMKRSGGNFLHKLKMLRQRGRGNHHNHDIKMPDEEPGRDAEELHRRVETTETSEDILAKYRRKSSTDSTRARRSFRRPSDPPPFQDMELERSEGVVDLDDPEVFNSMKQKLRIVLSNPDLHCAEYVPNVSTLAEWVRSAGCAGAAEVARALVGAGHARLAAALRRDLEARRPYAAYLTQCRAGLTHTLHHINRQINVVRAEWAACARIAAAARVLAILERSNTLHRLNGGCDLMDEKAARLTADIKAIATEVKGDSSWDGASAEMLEAVKVTVERAAFGRLYLHVLFPNKDGDILRDGKFSDHIRLLAACTSAASVGVPTQHVWAAPFPSAHCPLQQLAVYRAPRDKLCCITRCVHALMAILGMSDSAPSADDLTPVLVYVILRVNPPSLLSTVALVDALGGPALQGEALYCWTLFSAAVEYIKTMDYQRTQPGDS